jgi:hypothetical protein
LVSKELERFLALLPTAEHKRAIPLYDDVVRDLSNVGPVLLELLWVMSNHDDPQIHTSHALLTAVAGRDLLRLTRPPGGLPLLRFLVLYSFSLPKRTFSPAQADAGVRSVPPSSLEDASLAYARAIRGRLGDQAGLLLARIALDHGLDAAGHVAVRASFADLGRLGHNLVTAVAHVEAAEALEPPKRFVPLVNLGRSQALHLADVEPAKLVSAVLERHEADLEVLAERVEAGDFDRVERVLAGLAADGRADEAYRPLLVAASADPGFLGHTLSEVHAARLATRYLTPSENAWLSWKLYRTLTSRFGYPDFLRLSKGASLDRDSVLAALDASLRFRSPPTDRTLRQALESGVSLDEVLARIVDAYGSWTVGEKDHTISYLNAGLQTARFLGREDSLLPLVIALGKLPF